VKAILSKMSDLSKPRVKFMSHIFTLFMSLRCRYTFLNFGRYGDYCERSYRYHFKQSFDFLTFNEHLVQASDFEESLLVFDPSYLPKSGKHTAHVDWYYSGTASRRLRGLEVGVLALVDQASSRAMPLEVIQSTSPTVLKKKDQTLTDHYCELILARKDQLRGLSRYLVVDGFFAKQKFILPVLGHTDLDIICMLRKDADLRYLYQGPQPRRSGRKKQYDGKVNLKALDREKVEQV